MDPRKNRISGFSEYATPLSHDTIRFSNAPRKGTDSVKFFAVSLALCMLAAAAPSPNPTAATPFAAGDFGPALAAARTAIAADPADADARLTAGTIELYQNELGAAKADLAAIPAGTLGAANSRELGRRP